MNGIADTGFLALARFTSRSLYERRCNWDSEAGAYVANCRSQGGNDSQTVGLPCGPEGFSPDGSPCRSKLTAPRIWEFNAGAEREILPGIALGTVFVYRKFTRQWEDVETNANWNEGGTDLKREAPSRPAAPSSSSTCRPRSRPTAATAPSRRRCASAKAASRPTPATPGPTTRARATPASPASSSTTRETPSTTTAPSRATSATTCACRRPGSSSPGSPAAWSTSSRAARPTTASSSIPSTAATRACKPSGATTRTGTSTPTTTPPCACPTSAASICRLAAQLEPLIKKRVRVSVEAINLLALRTPLAVIQQDGPFWGQTQSRQPPTQLRFGAQFRF